MKCIFILLCVITLSAGIVSCGSHMPTYYYLIKTGPGVAKAEKTIPLRIDVNPFHAPGHYQNRMVYRRGGYEVGFYEYSQWVETPGEMVRRALINALDESGIFTGIDFIGSDPATDLDLNSEIESFDQVVEGEDNYAEFKLIMEFCRSDTGQPVWSHRVTGRVKQEGEGAFAAAMSEAVEKALARLIVAMEKSEDLEKLPGKLKEEKKRGNRE